jgi:hypothetical protein
MPEDQNLNQQVKLGFLDLIKNPKNLILMVGIVLLLIGLLRGPDIFKKASSWFTKDMVSAEVYKKTCYELDSAKQSVEKVTKERDVFYAQNSEYKKEAAKYRDKKVARDSKGDPIRDKDGNPVFETVSSASSSASGQHSEQYWTKEIELRDLKIDEQAKTIKNLESAAITQTTSITSHKESEEQRKYMLRITAGVLLTSELKPKACLGMACDVVTIPLINIPIAAGAWYSPPL